MIVREKPRATMINVRGRLMVTESAYGLWSLVILNSVFFIFFAFSFTKPKTALDWRGLGAFSAFVVALFTEMYGVPLTIYFLTPWLIELYPSVDFLAHNNGHLLHTLLGFSGDPHFDPLHLLSTALIVFGFYLLSSAWSVLHKAQKHGVLAQSGWYAKCRHPQYLAFIIIMFGFLLQWPTLPTLLMFPVLIWVYVRLAQAEEKLAISTFGDAYVDYQKHVPAWFPKWSRNQTKAIH